jgi:dihydrolipoamide dehydrogenase
MLSHLRGLETFGLELHGEVVPNLSKIIERKNKIVSTLVRGIRGLFKSWGISLKEGYGVFRSPSEIEVTSKEGAREIVPADKIIVATGSSPFQIPVLPFDGKNIISSNEAINLTEIPKSILIIGAGVIGCEFAGIFRELGADVTIVEMLPRALATEDVEISELLEREFKKKKIKLYTGVKLEKGELRNDGVHAFLSNGMELIADKALVSTGRKYNSEGIGLENTGINRGSRGEIMVNGKMETNVPGVYAIGDVIGGLLLAHVASKEGITAVINSMGGNENIDYTAVPCGIFTSPEIGSVGLREFEAQNKGIKVKTGHFQFRTLSKSHVIGDITGFFKVVSDVATDKILGVHIIGPHASDLIHEAAVAIQKGLRTKDITETIHAHPTLSEGLKEAAEDVHGEAIHALKK